MPAVFHNSAGFTISLVFEQEVKASQAQADLGSKETGDLSYKGLLFLLEPLQRLLTL
jgi:hypothetical protein